MTPALILSFRACLHGGGGSQIGEVTSGWSPHLSCKRNQIKMRDYMDRRITPPKRVTSPTWGLPPPCKQALSFPALRLNFVLVEIQKVYEINSVLQGRS